MLDDLPWVLTFARSAMLSTFSLFTASCLVDKVCSITLDYCRKKLNPIFHALHLLSRKLILINILMYVINFLYIMYTIILIKSTIIINILIILFRIDIMWLQAKRGNAL